MNRKIIANINKFNYLRGKKKSLEKQLIQVDLYLHLFFTVLLLQIELSVPRLQQLALNLKVFKVTEVLLTPLL